MNKKTLYIVLSISFVLFLILALVFNSKSNNAIENRIKSLRKFSNANGYTNSYIYIDYLGEAKDGYAIVFDGEDPYIAYFNDNLLSKIKEYNLDNRNIKIVGDGSAINDKIQDTILSIYNKDTVEGDEDYLSKTGFSNVFGDYYLYVDKIEDDHTLHKTPSFLSSLFLDLSLVSLLILCFKIILNRGKYE